jgi:hypothetical protein
MNLLDPFILFCAIEFVAVVALLVVWLDVDSGSCYIALSGHVTPELVYLQFPKPQESAPTGKDPAAGSIAEINSEAAHKAAHKTAPEAVPKVSAPINAPINAPISALLNAPINVQAAANDQAFKTLVTDP